jgi:hypothetical protein
MGPRCLLLDGLLFLLRLALPPVVTILGVAWKGTTPVVSAQVMVVVKEEWSVVIVIVMFIVVLVGFTVGLPAL